MSWRYVPSVCTTLLYIPEGIELELKLEPEFPVFKCSPALQVVLCIVLHIPGSQWLLWTVNHTLCSAPPLSYPTLVFYAQNGAYVVTLRSVSVAGRPVSVYSRSRAVWMLPHSWMIAPVQDQRTYSFQQGHIDPARAFSMETSCAAFVTPRTFQH